ncbi:hypothetical protein [Paraflavitalea speifideaquila]|uniref:hypothetical protein n=1 Tax=Paraflavitalea speifideaquila TaxID=3076558 RepID=UPI0028ECF4CE|nr:hypothetical protein [Paraflavitalea speifideiaquila]
MIKASGWNVCPAWGNWYRNGRQIAPGSHQKTSGELNELAIEKLKGIKDIAATPLLIQALNDYAVGTPVFNASLQALVENLVRLSAWENEAKMKAYLSGPSPNTRSRSTGSFPTGLLR